jgi:hypothetical protein
MWLSLPQKNWLKEGELDTVKLVETADAGLK